RFGCVFRSDELHALTDADLEAVGRLGIRVVFDLRNVDERDARPNRLPPGVEVLERATPSTGGDTRTTEQQILRGELPLADNEFTSTYFTPRRMDALAPTMSEHGVTEDQLRPLLEARRPVLDAMIEHVHDRWGGFDAYAREHVGVAPEAIERLRGGLLVAD